MIELLTSNHFDKIMDLFDGTQKEIKIISPFLSMSMAEKLCKVVTEKNIKCTFITRIYIQDMLEKANSLDAIELMMKSGIKVYAEKFLHTKLYLFDDTEAIVGSANFTCGGFKSNVELSLLLSEETEVITELHSYFDSMIQLLESADNGLVTEELLKKAKDNYYSIYNSKMHEGSGKVSSLMMYGAALTRKSQTNKTDELKKELDSCKNEKDKDIVNSLFKGLEQSEQIHYPYNIWLKFDGEGNDRLNADEPFPMTDVPMNGGTAYLSNYPFKVWSIEEDDHVYFAALTTIKGGKNLPVIVGRGTLAAFTDKNHVDDAMLQLYDWMDRYPWYCIIKECEVLNTTVGNGLPMNMIWEALGSDTYIASFGRNEDIPAVGRKHYQKAHIRLSGNAKDYIDKQFDILAEKYGTITYKSE